MPKVGPENRLRSAPLLSLDVGSARSTLNLPPSTMSSRPMTPELIGNCARSGHSFFQRINAGQSDQPTSTCELIGNCARSGHSFFQRINAGQFDQPPPTCPGCPLWVISGHTDKSAQCPLCPSIADIRRYRWNVRKVPSRSGHHGNLGASTRRATSRRFPPMSFLQCRFGWSCPKVTLRRTGESRPTWHHDYRARSACA